MSILTHPASGVAGYTGALFARLRLRLTLLLHPARLYWAWGTGEGADPKPDRATVRDFLRGFSVISCPDCAGHGVFNTYRLGPVRCNACKGKGVGFVGC